MRNASTLNTLRYDPQNCTGCGMCIHVCPHAVFTMSNHVAKLMNPDACMECGACQQNCPWDAIQVDSGVGCAAAMIRAALMRKEEAACG
jgi:NAD-dependent dihydropyrimidine dehydrogenase PreA subunit